MEASIGVDATPSLLPSPPEAPPLSPATPAALVSQCRASSPKAASIPSTPVPPPTSEAAAVHATSHALLSKAAERSPPPSLPSAQEYFSLLNDLEEDDIVDGVDDAGDGETNPDLSDGHTSMENSTDLSFDASSNDSWRQTCTGPATLKGHPNPSSCGSFHESSIVILDDSEDESESNGIERADLEADDDVIVLVE